MTVAVDGATVVVGFSGSTGALCGLRVDGHDLVASGGEDRQVRVWDPVTGHVHTTLTGHRGAVTGVCAVRVEGRDLLASASRDGTVRVWDPRSGRQYLMLEGHYEPVLGVTVMTVEGRELLVSVGADGPVRVWDPVTGSRRATLEGHTGPVPGVCTVQGGVRGGLLASGGSDANVRVWNPAWWEPFTTFQVPGGVNGLCRVPVGEVDLLAAAVDRTVWLWQPLAGGTHLVLEGHASRVTALCPVQVDRRHLLAAAAEDGTVRVWDSVTGRSCTTIEGHIGPVSALCTVRVEGRERLASAGGDHTVRLWAVPPECSGPDVYALLHHLVQPTEHPLLLQEAIHPLTAGWPSGQDIAALQREPGSTWTQHNAVLSLARGWPDSPDHPQYRNVFSVLRLCVTTARQAALREAAALAIATGWPDHPDAPALLRSVTRAQTAPGRPPGEASGQR